MKSPVAGQRTSLFPFTDTDPESYFLWPWIKMRQSECNRAHSLTRQSGNIQPPELRFPALLIPDGAKRIGLTWALRERPHRACWPSAFMRIWEPPCGSTRGRIEKLIVDARLVKALRELYTSGTMGSILRRLGGVRAGAGSTRGKRPGVMLPSTTVESAPVQEGTLAGRPCMVRIPITAKA
jgi:hypothetical protein